MCGNAELSPPLPASPLMPPSQRPHSGEPSRAAALVPTSKHTRIGTVSYVHIHTQDGTVMNASITSFFLFFLLFRCLRSVTEMYCAFFDVEAKRSNIVNAVSQRCSLWLYAPRMRVGCKQAKGALRWIEGEAAAGGSLKTITSN